ncbi:MAG: hypothetical protein HWN67_18715 [Candidatus Helarchaeota archaeon]|nr:hypothetical protein [Candidatus Helarchaeota archaeon]
MDIPGELVGIIAIISTFSVAAVFFIGLFYILFRSMRNKHEERLELIKSGKELPVEITRKPGKGTLYWGFIFGAFGGSVFVLNIIDMIRNIAIGRASRIEGEDFWGLIPLLIGVALILFYKFYEKGKENNEGNKEVKKEI